MADNITLNSGSGGSTLAADDISNVYHQRIKLVSGTDGTNEYSDDVCATAPLPVTVYPQSQKVFEGINSCAPTFYKVSVAAGSTTSIIAAGTGKIRVLAMVLTAETAAGTIEFKSGAGGTSLTGAMTIADDAALILPFNPVGWFETASATLLELVTVGCALRGSIVYIDTGE